MELAAARSIRFRRPSAEALTWLVTAGLLAAGSLWPEAGTGMLVAVAKGLLALLPVVAVAALLAGALTLGNWSDRALAWLSGRPRPRSADRELRGRRHPGVRPRRASPHRDAPAPRTAARAGDGVLGLLSGDDPSMLLITAGIIGLPFAVAKTVAAFGIGLFGGAVTWFSPASGAPATN